MVSRGKSYGDEQFFSRWRCLGNLKVILIFLNGTMHFQIPKIEAYLKTNTMIIHIQGHEHKKS